VGAGAHLSKLAVELLDQYKSVSQSVPGSQPSAAPAPFEPAVRRLDDEQIDELVRSYVAGEPITDLAKRLGIHRSTLYVRLERAGIDLRQRGALSPTQVQHAARLYERGDSLAIVGRLFSVDAQTVRNHLAKAGVKIRKRRGWG